MSGFKVNTTALLMYSNVLSGEYQHAIVAKRYADEHLQGLQGTGGGGGLFSEIQPMNDHARPQVQAAMSNLVEVCGASAEGLRGAASLYDHTDQRQAEAVDATYPAAGGPPRLPSLPGPLGELGAQAPTAIMERGNPEGHLKAPGEPPAFQDPNSVVNEISTWLSPSGAVQRGLEWTIGVNPAKEASQWLIGNWKGLLSRLRRSATLRPAAVRWPAT